MKEIEVKEEEFNYNPSKYVDMSIRGTYITVIDKDGEPVMYISGGGKETSCPCCERPYD